MLYDGFDDCGLQYGPGYRTLARSWCGASCATARLRVRSTQDGTQVHPADLDDALCIGALIPRGESAGNEPRVPFAVDAAALKSECGLLWAVR